MYASDYRLKARQSLAGNWGVAILVALVASILGGAIKVFGFELNFNVEGENISSWSDAFRVAIGGATITGSFMGIVQFILGGPVRLGNCKYLLNQHDRREKSFGDLFSMFSHFGNGFLLQLLTWLYTFLWSLLLVIPGIVASYRYAMAPFIMAEHPEMSAGEAINESKHMMYGHKWALFCLDFSFIGWAILSALTLGIGSLFLNPYTSAARAAFYRNLCGEHPLHQNPTSHAGRNGETPWDF